MSIGLRWLLKERIVLVSMIPLASEEELAESDIALQADFLDASSTPPVHVILDGRNMEHLPGLLPLASQGWFQHPNLGWALPVGHRHEANRARGELVAIATGSNLRHFDTIADALSFLQAEDATLPDLTAIDDEDATG